MLFSELAVGQDRLWADSMKKIVAVSRNDTSNVKSLILLSNAYTFSEPDSAVVYARKALSLAENIDFDAGKFWAIVAMNKALYFLGNYALELEYAFKALPISKHLNTPSSTGWANGMLGDCYFNLGEFRTALGYYRTILKAAELQSLKDDLPSMYSGFVPVFIALRQNDSALLYAKRGYELSTRNPLLNGTSEESKYNKSLQFKFLGDAYGASGYFDSALTYYRMSLPFSEEMHMEMTTVDAYNGLAKMYQELRKADSAVWYAQKVLTGKMVKTYPVAVLKAANTLTDIYAFQNNPDSTLKYLRIAYAIKDSLFNREKTIAAQNILFQQQEDQKEMEAARAALRTRFLQYFFFSVLLILMVVALIVLKHKRKIQLQKMRNSIADDLHDDIGSALSSIGIMNELARKRLPDAKHLLGIIGENTAAVQENLSDIVWAISSEKDRFETVFQRMCRFAAEILEAKNIELDIGADARLYSISLTMEQRKNIYLFFKESVNNAAKHSEAKRIVVRLSRRDGKVEMVISDNGKGFQVEGKSNGNGMSTLKKRAADLHADFKLTSVIDVGTTIELRFKYGN